MIFKEIHIDGFGIFKNLSLIHLKQGINIILGNNEAGKSTLLKFIRYTLFGYPKSPDQRMPPLTGGEHGGRIRSILSDKKNVTFERTSGSSGGNIKLIYEGRSLEDQVLWNQLLGNATKNIFESIYAFSLEELVNLESLSKSGVEDKIFSVGLGLGNISIRDVESNIQKQVDQIYTQRGKVQQIPAILNKILLKKNQVLEIQNKLPLYRELIQRIQQLGNEIVNIENYLNEGRNQKEKLDKYLNCYENFVTIIKIDEELKALPKLQIYPSDGIEQLKMMETEEKGLNEIIQELQNGNEYEKGIDELKEEINSISINQKLLKNFEKIEYLRTNIELYKQTVNEKLENERKIKILDKSIKQELNSISSEWTEQNIEDFSDDILHQNKIRDFKEKLEKIENNKRDIEAQQKLMQTKVSPININSIFIFISLVFIFGAIIGFYYSLTVLGIICLIISLLLFFGRKVFIRESFLGKIQEQLSVLLTKEKEIKNAYEEYLGKKLNLEKSLSIESVLEIFIAIRQLKKNINELDELKRKLEEERVPFINKFEEEVKSMLEISEIRQAGNNNEIFVKQIIQEFDTTETQSQKKKELQNTILRRQKELERTKDKLKKNKQLLTKLLGSINANSKDDFRKKYEVNNNVKDLINSRKNAVANIETIFGLNKSDEVIDFLKVNEQQDLMDQLKKLEKEIFEKSEELNIKYSELGKKKSDIERIEGESELSQIMTELESERQKLNNAYKEWISGKIGLKLLGDVKRNYERDKQPEVIKNSNNYFNKITGERYKRISVSMDEKEVSVFDAREVSKKIEQLSRGTREQLLISLRLGFIEEYERKAEPLPVIVDEVLVNFDPGRAKKTAEILYEFGKKRQILIFTCHPETLGYFEPKTVNEIYLNYNA